MKLEPEGRNSLFYATAALGLLSLIVGCRVGPHYHAPAPPAVTAPNYKESTVNFQNEPGWKVASPQEAMIRGNWWEIYHEPELNALEEQLNINNQNIKTAFEEFMAARAVIAQARSQYWPSITASPAWSRSKSSGNLRQSQFANTGATSTLWSLPVNVSWTPDFWGKIRNEVHTEQYAAQVSAADLQLEKLTEQAALANYFFEIRGQDMLQQIINQTVAADQQALDSAQGAYDAGTGDYIAVIEATTTLKSAQSAAINVRLIRHGAGQVRLTVADNGAAPEQSANEVAGLGTQLIRMLARQLNGTVSIERADGTYAVHVTFPLQSAVSWRPAY